MTKKEKIINQELEPVRKQISKYTKQMHELRGEKKKGKDVKNDLHKTLVKIHELRDKKKEILKKL